MNGKRNFKIYSIAFIGLAAYVGGIPLALHLQPKPLISKEELKELHSSPNIPLVEDYSQGGKYPEKLFAVDCNNDGLVDALVKYDSATISNLPFSGSGNYDAVWHTDDWTGDKNNSRLMTSQVREIATRMYKDSKDLSSLLLEDARK
jgi:hypothetical protein